MGFLDPILKPVLEVGAAMLSRDSLPQLEGRLSLAGLHQPVEIYRDRWGIPHIYSQNLPDLFFGQGYVHAQDRLWQMDFNRRLVSGRLAEVLGAEALQVDRWIRVLGMRYVSEQEEALLEDSLQEMLEAYASGVNARMAQGHFPVEFSLLGYHPEPWSVVDSLSWSKMMAWMLSGNWESELTRAALIDRLGPQKAAELELEDQQPWPNEMRVVLAGLQALNLARQNRPLSGPGLTDGVGSNNWVISGSRTASGKPLLANDMHLSMGMPAVWYENHLCGGEIEVTGVSLPGVPLVIAGHNGNVAWGFTAGFADVQDLYIEHLHKDDQGKIFYEYRGKWLPVSQRQEEIRVRGAEPVMETVIGTRHGPVINSLIENFVTDDVLALRWTALEPEITIKAMWDMTCAHTCLDFREALRNWGGPVVNTIYADTQGNIAYSLPGRVPLRQRGSGRVPAPGWTGEHEWLGMIPFDELPHLFNPPQGFIATANNRVADDSYPYDLGNDYVIGDRAQRIVELIAQTERADLAWMQRMQFDQISPSARWVTAYLGQLETDDPQLEAVVRRMRSWNGALTVDSPEASIYEVFMRRIIPLVLADKLGDLTEQYAGRGPTPQLAEGSLWGSRSWEWLQKTLGDPDSPWFDLGHGERRDDVLRMALSGSLDYLRGRLGPDMDGWAWGKLHQLTFHHVLSQGKPLDLLFDRGPYPIGGDGTTLWASLSQFEGSESDTHLIGPPFRFITDLSDLCKSVGILAPGQSGQPGSPHYDDQVEGWFQGKYHPMLYMRDDVQHEAKHHLVLEPEQVSPDAHS